MSPSTSMSHRVFSAIIALSLVVVTAVLVAALMHATDRMLVTM